jgi:hypothetical protein
MGRPQLHSRGERTVGGGAGLRLGAAGGDGMGRWMRGLSGRATEAARETALAIGAGRTAGTGDGAATGGQPAPGSA